MKTIKSWISVLLTVILLLSSVSFALASGDPVVVYEGTCGAQGSQVTWKITDDGTLTISGSGGMLDYGASPGMIAPWTEAIVNELPEDEAAILKADCFPSEYYLSNNPLSELLSLIADVPIGKVVVEEGVTSIGNFAFFEWPTTSVSLPSTLKSIGVRAFEGGNFTTVDVPDGVTDIMDAAFREVPLKTAILPASVENVAYNIFEGNPYLQSLVVLNSELDCSNLTIPSGYVDSGFMAPDSYRLCSGIFHWRENYGLSDHADFYIANYVSNYGISVSLAESWFKLNSDASLLKIARSLGIDVDPTNFNSLEVNGRVLDRINEILGTSFSVAEMMEIIDYPVLNMSFANALLDSIEEDVGLDSVYVYVMNAWLCADPAFAEYEIKEMVQDGSSRTEAEASWAETVSDTLEQANSFFGLDATSPDDLISQMINLVEEKQGLSFTRETIAQSVQTPMDFSDEMCTAIAQRFGFYNTYFPDPGNAYLAANWGVKSPWFTVYGAEGSAVQAAAEEGGVSFEVYNGHVHDYQCEIITMPSCSQPGEYRYSCSCGKQYTREVEPFPNHQWQSVSSTSSSCAEPGSTTFICRFCGESYSEEWPALPHTPGEPVAENEISATCESAGSYQTVVYCTVCGAEISRVTETTEMLGHTPGAPATENLIPSTVETEGSYDEVVYCSVCGKELSRETKIIEKIEHEHEAGEPTLENQVPATCSQEGSADQVVRCTICGQIMSSEHIALEKLPHTPGEPEIYEQAPTCAQEGYHREVAYCTVCGELAKDETQPIEKLPHTFGEMELVNEVSPTCTEDGSIEKRIYCTVCGGIAFSEPEVIPAAHQYDTTIVEEATCTQAGLRAYTCSVCGDSYYEEIPAKNHPHIQTVIENQTEATQTSEGSYDVVERCEDCGAEFSRVTKTQSYLVGEGTYGDNIHWSLTSRGLLTISGTGAMEESTDFSPAEGNVMPQMPWTEAVFNHICEMLSLEDFDHERFVRYIYEEGAAQVESSTLLSHVFGTNDYAAFTDPFDSQYNKDIIYYPEVMQLLRESVKTIVVEEGVTSVCAGAFVELWPNVISVSSTVEQMGDLAFSGILAQKIILENPQLDPKDSILLFVAQSEDILVACDYTNVNSYFNDLLKSVHLVASTYDFNKASALVTELFNGKELKRIVTSKWLQEDYTLKNKTDTYGGPMGYALIVDMDELPSTLFEAIDKGARHAYTEGYENARIALMEKIPAFNEIYNLTATTIEELVEQALDYINTQFALLDSDYEPITTLKDAYKIRAGLSCINRYYPEAAVSGMGPYEIKVLGVAVNCTCLLATAIDFSAFSEILMKSTLSFGFAREWLEMNDMISAVFKDETLKTVLGVRYIRSHYSQYTEFDMIRSPEFLRSKEAIVMQKLPEWNSRYNFTATTIDELLEQALAKYNAFSEKWGLGQDQYFPSLNELYIINVAILPEDDLGTKAIAYTVNLQIETMSVSFGALEYGYGAPAIPFAMRVLFPLGCRPLLSAWIDYQIRMFGKSELEKPDEDEDEEIAFFPWVTIYGPEESAAQAAAQQSGLAFQVMTEMDIHTPAKPVRENVKPASCTAAGSSDIVTYCSVCCRELSRETRIRQPKAHSPGVIVRENVVAATELQAGSYDDVQYCSVCAQEMTRTPKTMPLLLASGTCGENIAWQLFGDGTLKIGGTGGIEPQVRTVNGTEEAYFPWEDAIAEALGVDYLLSENHPAEEGETMPPAEMIAYFNQLWNVVQTLEIEDGVTAIPAGTFSGLVPKKIVLPASLNVMGEDAINAMFATELTIANPGFNSEDSGILIGGYVKEAFSYRSLKAFKQSFMSAITAETEMMEKFMPVMDLYSYAMNFYGYTVYSAQIDPTERESYIRYLVSEWNAIFGQNQEAKSIEEVEAFILQAFNDRLNADFISITELFDSMDGPGAGPSAMLLDAVGITTNPESLYSLMGYNYAPFYELPLGAEPVVEVNEYDQETGKVIGTRELPLAVFPWLTIRGQADSAAQEAAELYGLTFVALDAAQPDQIQKTDASTGISLTFSEASYDGTVILVVEETEEGTPLSDEYDKVKSWDITTLVNGEEAQPNGPVMVSIPLPDGFDPNHIAVYHVENGAAVRIQNVTVENGFIRFFADSFSVYVVVDESDSGAQPDHIPGDINGDNTLNNKDLTRLMKYLAGEDVDVVEAALDVNGDGVVNNKDLTRLMKYLAGEDVTIH